MPKEHDSMVQQWKGCLPQSSPDFLFNISVTPGKQRLLSNTICRNISPSSLLSLAERRTKHKLRWEQQLWLHPAAKQEEVHRVRNWTGKRLESNRKANKEKRSISGGPSLCLQARWIHDDVSCTLLAEGHWKQCAYKSHFSPTRLFRNLLSTSFPCRRGTLQLLSELLSSWSYFMIYWLTDAITSGKLSFVLCFCF